MSETETGGYRPPEATKTPEPAPIPAQKKTETLNPAPTTEARQSPEVLREGPREGLQAALILGIDVPETGKELNRRERWKLKKTGTLRSPSTHKVKNSSLNERINEWQSKDAQHGSKRTLEQQLHAWAKDANAYLNQFAEDSPEREFLKKNGLEGDAMTLAQKVEDDWKNDPGKFGEMIGRKNTPEQIQQNKELIHELAKVFGSEGGVEDAINIAEGIAHMRERPEEFMQSAQEQLRQGKDMTGFSRLQEINDSSDAWLRKITDEKNRKKQEKKDAREEEKRKKRAEKAREAGRNRTQDPESDDGEKTIQEKIKAAEEEAISADKLTELINRQDSLLHQLKEGKITEIEFTKQQTELQDINKGVIDFVDAFGPEEPEQQQAVRLALKRLGKKKEEIDSYVFHEQRHFKMAEKLGLNPKYAVQLSKEKDATFDVRVSVKHDDASPTEAEAILSAPGIDYEPQADMTGNGVLSYQDMSTHDLIALGFDKDAITNKDRTANIIAQSIDKLRESKGDMATQKDGFVQKYMDRYHTDNVQARRRLGYLAARHTRLHGIDALTPTVIKEFSQNLEQTSEQT